MKATTLGVLWRFLLLLFCLLLATSSAYVLTGHAKARITSLLKEPEPLPSAPITVVIDAGHGGEDGGASSESGIVEKNLNLSIAKQLAALLRANGVRVVMTREEDVLLYDRNVDYQGRKKQLDLQARREIAEATSNCIFVSIHMNSYPQPRYRGLQVWYSPNDERSLSLAERIQQITCEKLQPENDRACKRATSSIYLLHRLTVPAVLVECGFLSNPEEASLLADPAYQRQLSLVLFSAILEELNQ